MMDRRRKQGAAHRLPPPQTRPLKVYAFDPSRGHYLGNELTLHIPFEPLARGPAGRRLAVVDYDSSNRCTYEPVNLDDPAVLLRGGLDPAEANPQFHQQMVYAVAMDTVQQFETALGRRLGWRRGARAADTITTLKLYPHAMQARNAFYAPEAQGILFGYFRADADDPGRNLPGQTIFTCLSHDIIIHEITHALMDGLRRHFTEPTNLDVAAFHEAFADLAALFRHFARRSPLLRQAIQNTGGRLFEPLFKPRVDQMAGNAAPVLQAQQPERNPLIELARQFGDATGRHAGLRSALGVPAQPKAYATQTEPHARGAILVAAVFDAYFSTYLRRVNDLFRIYRASAGSTEADIPAPLVHLLATEASRTAQEFFTLCVRALDYCPPLDITFGSFLRALITTHCEEQPRDADHVREALMNAFRLRGVLPTGAQFFSEEALCWQQAESRRLPPVRGLVFGDPNGLTPAEQKTNASVLLRYAKANCTRLGFDPRLPVAVPSFHQTFRVGGDGRLRLNLVVELVQTRMVPLVRGAKKFGAFPLRGGATVIISKPLPDAARGANQPVVRYVIYKHLHGEQGRRREARQRLYYQSQGFLEGPPDDPRRFQLDYARIHGGGR